MVKRGKESEGWVNKHPRKVPFVEA